MSKFWKGPQNIIALGVTLISVCALIVSISQTRIMIRQSEMMGRQARESVRPILTFNRYRAFDPETRQLIEYRMSITNGGVGPASVGDVAAKFAGEPIENWWSLFSSHAIIQAGQGVTFLDLSDNLELARRVYGALDRLGLRFPYRFTYGDRFEGRLTTEGWRNVDPETAE